MKPYLKNKLLVVYGVLHLHIKFLYGKAWNNINEPGFA